MKALKGFTIFTAGGLCYGIVEILWRGSTHISMFIVGGLCFYIIGQLDEHRHSFCLIGQAAISSLVITAIEFSSGVIINIALDLNVWDYSRLPMNVLGQICLPFSILWLLLSVPAIYFEDFLRHCLFGEPMKKISLLPRLKSRSTAEI